MKKGNFSEKEMELLDKDIDKKRLGKMKLQTGHEFKQRNIEELNKKFDVKLQHTLKRWKSFCSRTKNS